MIFHFEVSEAWSCDNFVVTASDSDKARAKVEAFLRKTYAPKDAEALIKKLRLEASTKDCVHISQSFD
jgi:hypothetical protein